MREYRNAKNDKYDENNNTLEKILEIELTENENNQNKKIINEIIKIFIESNLTATESRNILDNVRRRIGVQRVTDDCLIE
ncbi:MAG: hypothetical protein ACLTVG_01605 [Coprococcus sp.]